MKDHSKRFLSHSCRRANILYQQMKGHAKRYLRLKGSMTISRYQQMKGHAKRKEITGGFFYLCFHISEFSVSIETCAQKKLFYQFDKAAIEPAFFRLNKSTDSSVGLCCKLGNIRDRIFESLHFLVFRIAFSLL